MKKIWTPVQKGWAAVRPLPVVAPHHIAKGNCFVANLPRTTDVHHLRQALPENTLFFTLDDQVNIERRALVTVKEASLALQQGRPACCLLPGILPPVSSEIITFLDHAISRGGEGKSEEKTFIPLYVHRPSAAGTSRPLLLAGPPAPCTNAQDVERALRDLSVEAHSRQKGLLQSHFIRLAKRRWFLPFLADSSGQTFRYGKALTLAIVLAYWIEKNIGRPGQAVAILLPASAMGAILNAACLMAGRVPVNLNFTTGRAACDAALSQIDAAAILTSRRFITKLGWEDAEAVDSGMIFLEELAETFSIWQKLRGFLLSGFLPASLLVRRFRHKKQKTDGTATILFSSGTTGNPKGIVLTHQNILANIEGVLQTVDIGWRDCFAGVLPFFHSFGFTATLWLPLVHGVRCAYHPNPLDAGVISKLAAQHKISILPTTPTFCRTYIKKCKPEDFASLRLVITGAEKLPDPVAQSFHETFGVEILEGYGCTELGPVVAVNSPKTGHQPGTVGRPIPGVAVRIVEEDSNTPLPPEQSGLLEVRSAARMTGYYKQPNLTASVLHDGWYNTGDVAMVTADGFLKIVDRLARFSKIGGEMVPHLKVENALADLLSDPHRAIVTALPDPRKGEKLVVLYTGGATPKDLVSGLKAHGENLPNLWIPRAEDFLEVAEIPLTGTGKTDLKAARQIAKDAMAEQEEAA